MSKISEFAFIPSREEKLWTHIFCNKEKWISVFDCIYFNFASLDFFFLTPEHPSTKACKFRKVSKK